MDDFVSSTLALGRDEWYVRLQQVLTPWIIHGIREIFNEAFTTCKEQNELQNYLAMFQSLLQLVPKWTATVVEAEKKRILERSGCSFLEDLISCVHIIQLKALTSVRVGNKQKKIDLSIPNVNVFIHKVYIHAARTLFKNVYLFDAFARPVDVQKHNREIELIVNEAVLNAVREGIPTEYIIRAYLDDESIEHEELVKVETVMPDADEEDEEDNKAAATTTPDFRKPLALWNPPPPPPLPLPLPLPLPQQPQPPLLPASAAAAAAAASSSFDMDLEPIRLPEVLPNIEDLPEQKVDIPVTLVHEASGFPSAAGTAPPSSLFLSEPRPTNSMAFQSLDDDDI